MQSGAPNNIEPTLEKILQLVKQLPRPEVARLREILSETLHETLPPRERRVDPIIPQADFSLSAKWLAEHKTEYAGQWVALEGDRLIAHGADAKEVYAVAGASGVKYPMVTQVDDPTAPPFAGF